jgi:hypothetical protein
MDVLILQRGDKYKTSPLPIPSLRDNRELS